MNRVFAAVVAVLALTGVHSVASAQNAMPAQTALPNIPEPNLNQLELARKLIDLTGTSRTFDELLPNIADKAKTTFIRGNPQMQLGIIDMVDKVALELVERRGELNNELARTWALAFSEAELQQLIDFYSSDLGKKLSAEQPQIMGMQMMYAERWSSVIAQEMARRVTEEMRASAQAETASMTGAAPSPDLNAAPAAAAAKPAPAAPAVPAAKPKK
jgi:hypothetical protein